MGLRNLSSVVKAVIVAVVHLEPTGFPVGLQHSPVAATEAEIELNPLLADWDNISLEFN